jgi:hypothetical protein
VSTPVSWPPNWTDPETYEVGGIAAVRNWSPQRWAWEFLRRNPDYQAASDKHAGKPSSTRAEERGIFGIRKILRYSDPWTPAHDENWLASRLAKNSGSFQFNPSSGSIDDTKLQLGEVAFVFDISQALTGGKQAIRMMMSKVEAFLLDELEYVEQRTGETRVEYSKPEKYETLFESLRIYDAKVAKEKATNNELAQVFFPDLEGRDNETKEEKNARDNKIAKRVSPRNILASGYVNGGYRAFLIYEPEPDAIG